MLTSWIDLAVGELNTGRVTARQDDLPNQGVATNPQSQVDPCGLEFTGPMRAIAGRDPGCRGSNAAGVGVRGVLARPRVVRAGPGRAGDNIAPAERDLNGRLRARRPATPMKSIGMPVARPVLSKGRGPLGWRRRRSTAVEVTSHGMVLIPGPRRRTDRVIPVRRDRSAWGEPERPSAGGPGKV